MKNKIILILAFVLFAQLANAQKTIDKVVATVGNETILLSDVEEMVMYAKAEGMMPEGNIRCFALEELMSRKLFIAQAKLDSLNVDLDNIDKSVERRYKYFLVEYGSESAVVERLKKTKEEILRTLHEMETENTYSNTMRHQITNKITASPSDVEKYFKELPTDSLPKMPDQYIIYQIVKRPNSAGAAIAAKQKLLDLRKRILAGERFQSLATLYSEDPGSARRGGEVGLSPLENWVPPVREALKKMRPGQVSQIIESEYGYHIVQLIELQSDNMVNYRHILVKPKYTDEDRQYGYKQLDTLVRLIKSDSITFEKAAFLFSDDKQSSMGNGLLVNNKRPYPMPPSPRFNKEDLNPDDYIALKNLPNQEISEPFESTDYQGNVVYKVIMVKEFIPAHTANFKDDYDMIREATLQKKQNDAIGKWIKQKQKTEYIRVDRSFKDCDFEHEGWFK